MRIHIVAIGRARAGPERDLFEAYRSRITRQIFSALTFKEIELRRPAPPNEAPGREAALLLDQVPKGATLVALDERGKNLTSLEFASFLERHRDSGQRDTCFVIGGADGLAESLRERAQLTLSFGAATWPHLLARALLVEQLYRAQTILTGHPYHRG